jgi:VanZ family protein
MEAECKAWQKLDQMHSRTLGIICIVIVLITLVAGLWPFNFFLGNKVEWLMDRNGVHFYGQGMIISTEALNDFQNPSFPDRSITLEFWLRPLSVTRNLPHILTLYDGKAPDIALVGQWKTHLIIRSRTDNPSAHKRGKPYQEIGLSNALLKNRDVFITITSGSDGSVIYINGRLAQAYPRHRLLAETTPGDVRMIIGNGPTGKSYWNGNLMGLAVYNGALSADQVFSSYKIWTGHAAPPNSTGEGCLGMYFFQEKAGTVVHNACGPGFALAMPTTFKPLQRIVLSPPWQDFRWDWSFVSDVAVNIAGFIPLGFFFSVFLWRSTQRGKYFVYTTTLLMGFGLSLAIELTQVYLPTRYSQLADLVCNVAGTILGLVIFCIFHRVNSENGLRIIHTGENPP